MQCISNDLTKGLASFVKSDKFFTNDQGSIPMRYFLKSMGSLGGSD